MHAAGDEAASHENPSPCLPQATHRIFPNNPISCGNPLADQSPGFVWRYTQEDECEAGRDVFGDESLLFNMSMWESKEALMDYVYKSDHVQILRKRAEWFESQDRPILALWWQLAGTIPTVVEAKHRLERLAQAGPTEDAFTFRHFFEAPQIEDYASG